MRNGEQVLLTLVIPLALLVLLPRTPLLEGTAQERLAATVPGVLALAVLASAFTAQAIGLAFDRRSGVIRHLGAGPLGRSGLVLARTLAVIGVVAVQVSVILIAALLLGWRPEPGTSPVPLALVLVLGIAAFTGPALLMGGTLRAEAVLAGANLVFLVLLIGGGLFPADGIPEAGWLPSAALADAVAAVLTGAAVPVGPVLVLAAWATAGGAAAARWLRWD
jgi:ABC-2 type transport system permease protein